MITSQDNSDQIIPPKQDSQNNQHDAEYFLQMGQETINGEQPGQIAAPYCGKEEKWHGKAQ